MSELSAKVPDTPGARRAANEQAVKLAVAGRWQEAAALNRELIARFGDDATAFSWIEDGRLPIPTIVTFRCTIEQVNEATALLEGGEIVGQAVMVIEPLR